MQESPDQQWTLLRKLVPARCQPLLRGIRKRWQRRRLSLEEPFHTVYPFTQASQWRQKSILRLAEVVTERAIPGDIVECGVLDGGMSGLMAWGTRTTNKFVHLFDAWRGLPRSSDDDGASAKKWEGQVVGSPRRVRAVMSELGIPAERLRFHQGWFHETFPTADIPKISLLHIDPDFYDPVKLCLERWFPHMSAGGFIQIDDYAAFQGCRRAVDEFLAANRSLTLQEHGEGSGRAYFIEIPPTASLS